MNGPGWYQRLPRLAREAIDQTLHFVCIGGLPAAAFGGFACAVVSGSPPEQRLVAGLCAGLGGTAVAVLYELLQNWGDKNNRYGDMALDLSFEVGGAWSVAALFFRFA